MSSILTPVIVVVAVVAVVAVTTVWQWNLSRRFAYRCAKCGHDFSPSPLAAALAPHRFGGLKLLKCPDCGGWSWATVVGKPPEG